METGVTPAAVPEAGAAGAGGSPTQPGYMGAEDGDSARAAGNGGLGSPDRAAGAGSPEVTQQDSQGDQYDHPTPQEQAGAGFFDARESCPASWDRLGELDGQTGREARKKASRGAASGGGRCASRGHGKKARLSTTSEQAQKLRISAQPTKSGNGRMACCTECKEKFTAGEWRGNKETVGRRADSTHSGLKYWHLKCMDAFLPDAGCGFYGYSELGQGERDHLDLILARRKAAGAPVAVTLPPLEPTQTPLDPAGVPAAAADDPSGEGAGEAADDTYQGEAAETKGPSLRASRAEDRTQLLADQNSRPTAIKEEPPSDATNATGVHEMDLDGDEADLMQQEDMARGDQVQDIDPLLHDGMQEEEGLESTHFPRMEHWDEMSWDHILLTAAPTTSLIPSRMTHAVGAVRIKICKALERAHREGAEVDQDRLWKLFVMADAMLFVEGRRQLRTPGVTSCAGSSSSSTRGTGRPCGPTWKTPLRPAWRSVVRKTRSPAGSGGLLTS